MVIPNGYSSLPFTMEQTYTHGPSIQMSYKCMNKTFTVASKQDYCFFNAGKVYGDIISSNNVHVDNKITLGSYFYLLPGQINWTIY